MRLPKKSKPAVRRASTAALADQMGPSQSCELACNPFRSRSVLLYRLCKAQC